MVDVIQTADEAKQITDDQEKQVKGGHSCPHMARLGVCLEPKMCFLVHKVTPVAQVMTNEKMSVTAKEFNPFTAQAQSAASKEFNPEVTYAPVSQQANVIDSIKKMGIDAQVDSEMGTIFVQKFESCTCCKGFVNNCQGKECEFLGQCSCVTRSAHDEQ